MRHSLRNGSLTRAERDLPIPIRAPHAYQDRTGGARRRGFRWAVGFGCAAAVVLLALAVLS